MILSNCRKIKHYPNELLDNRKEKSQSPRTNVGSTFCHLRMKNAKLLHLQDPECLMVQKYEQKIRNGDAQMWIRITIIRLISPLTSKLPSRVLYRRLGSYPWMLTRRSTIELPGLHYFGLLITIEVILCALLSKLLNLSSAYQGVIQSMFYD